MRMQARMRGVFEFQAAGKGGSGAGERARVGRREEGEEERGGEERLLMMCSTSGQRGQGKKGAVWVWA